MERYAIKNHSCQVEVRLLGELGNCADAAFHRAVRQQQAVPRQPLTFVFSLAGLSVTCANQARLGPLSLSR